MRSKVAITCMPAQISFGPIIFRNQPVAELGYDVVELHLRMSTKIFVKLKLSM